MIDQPQQSTTLRVCLEDVGTHNKAVLDFFFAKLGQQTFNRVDSQEEANVLIIDYDFPPARQRYESDYQAWHKPAIILSISEVSLDNVIWLPKPLTSRALIDAATSAQGLLKNDTDTESHKKPSAKKVSLSESAPAFIANKPTSLQRPITKPVEVVASAPLVSSAIIEKTNRPLSAEPSTDLPVEEPVETLPEVAVEPVQTDEAQQERWSLLCGDSSDVDVSTSLASLQTEESFFLSSVKDAVRLARQCQQGVLLNFPKTKIYVLPEVHRVFCTVAVDRPEFVQLINDCNSGDGGKMHILSTPEIHELNDLILQQSDALYDLESFVWSSTLLSAQGVLPRELDPNKPVGLKHWPSMTRVEQFPHVMPIAAQWSTGAVSAFDIAKSLNIPQRYVFSFYNAANALGLIEMDPDKLIKKQSAPRKTEAPSGLFSRLLKRLIGG
jgi:hypothetical protein